MKKRERKDQKTTPELLKRSPSRTFPEIEEESAKDKIRRKGTGKEELPIFS